MGWQTVGHDTPFMWNLKRNDTNELIYKTETDPQTYRMNLWLPKGTDSWGVWDQHGHTAVFKTDNHPGPTVQHRELFSMLRGRLDGRRVWGRSDTHVGFPGGAGGTGPAYQCRRQKKCGCSSWAGKIPWRRDGNPLQYFCLESPMDRVYYSVVKSRP